MRLSQFPITTTKETPADAEIVSHQLMLRAGLIRRLSSGLFSWMPLGLRVLQRVEAIVREEMTRAGAVELLMPSIQPAELWEESGRWTKMGPQMLKMRDRHDRDFCYGPTHEEVICHHVRQDVKSYKQLPVNYFQIQTKFRDEIRPRFGVMRSREFLMKDAYSFHIDAPSLEDTYQAMRAAYTRIFERIGVDFRIVQADSGDIGGSRSEEFHVLAASGEDALAVARDGQFAANVEAAATLPAPGPRPAPSAEMQQVETPHCKTIDQVSSHLDIAPQQCLKTLLVMGCNDKPLALVVRGDHDINDVKAANHPLVRDPFTLVDEAAARACAGAGFGSLGPVGLDMPVIVDHAAAALSDFACGANADGMHLINVNWGRDLPEPQVADLRTIRDGDPSPTGEGPVQIVRGIEVGHIFQLGRKYTESMNVTVLDADGREVHPEMGCYGIGVTRVVAACIEQCADDKGIVWPESIAPFSVVVAPINAKKSVRAAQAARELYDALLDQGINAALDDRNLRPGVMFADLELIGIPHRIVVGDRTLDRGALEYKARDADAAIDIPNTLDAVLAALRGDLPDPA